MNSMSRGIRGALRSPLRSGAIILILAISIGLLLAMLVARGSINDKIASVKAQAGTDITINPAGIRGGIGGGTPLTADQVAKIAATTHITSAASSLTDQLGSSDTNLTSSLTLGSFGQRQMRFEQQGSTAPTSPDSSATPSTNRPAPTPRTSVTGTNHPETIVSTKQLTSGAMIDAATNSTTALVGKSLADKNNLSTGSTFTAYGKTFTVSGIYTTGSTFQDSGIVVPLATLQTLTGQADAVTAVTATVDSADNVTSTVGALKTTFGSNVDITSQIDRAAQNAASLETIATLALDGVIGAAVAGIVVIMLAMIIVVRERRREIGIIKAIGGTNRSVVMQLMSEALTLTVVSAVIGLALGVIVSGPMTNSLVTSQTQPVATRGAGGFRGAFARVGSQLNTNLRSVTASVTPTVFGISVAATLGMALIGSIIPALLVARIRPAEVLRTE